MENESSTRRQSHQLHRCWLYLRSQSPSLRGVRRIEFSPTKDRISPPVSVPKQPLVPRRLPSCTACSNDFLLGRMGVLAILWFLRTSRRCCAKPPITLQKLTSEAIGLIKVEANFNSKMVGSNGRAAVLERETGKPFVALFSMVAFRRRRAV